jgi:hypothetical protein
MMMVVGMMLPLWPEPNVNPLNLMKSWGIMVNLGALGMMPKLMQTLKELRCERVIFDALGLGRCKDILAPSGLRTFYEMNFGRYPS